MNKRSITNQIREISEAEQLLNQYRGKVRDLDNESDSSDMSMRLYLAKIRVLDFWLLDELEKVGVRL